MERLPSHGLRLNTCHSKHTKGAEPGSEGISTAPLGARGFGGAAALGARVEAENSIHATEPQM